MKIDKYDRQIRLWGKSGQKKLSEAKVALLGCSGPGIQALKNLILPAVGQVDIWDDNKITIEDLSSTFFYEHDKVGSFRAQEASKNLLQMNPDVEGKFFNKSPKELLENEAALKQYTLVICSDLSDELNQEASKKCWKLDIPIVFIDVCGFFFHIRNQRKSHFVTSQNNTSKKYYLRLHDPFENLKNHSKKWDISALIAKFAEQKDENAKGQLKKEIGKIPYPIILLQAYEQLPPNSKQKSHLLQSIKKWQTGFGDDIPQNFAEATSRTLDIYQTPDNFLQDIGIFDHELVDSANPTSSFVLIFLKAVKEYYKNEKNLPQPTKLPDISTSTANYIELKNVYKKEHERSIELLKKIISDQQNGYAGKDQEISQHINNIQALRIIQMRPFFQEMKQPQDPMYMLGYTPAEMRNLAIAIRSFKRFQQQNQRPPNPFDFDALLQIAETMKQHYKLEDIDARYIKEACRCSGKSTISISSIAGAIAGQEAIKLITNCFEPVNNGYFYDGFSSVGFNVKL